MARAFVYAHEQSPLRRKTGCRGDEAPTRSTRNLHVSPNRRWSGPRNAPVWWALDSCVGLPTSLTRPGLFCDIRRQGQGLHVIQLLHAQAAQLDVPQELYALMRVDQGEL